MHLGNEILDLQLTLMDSAQCFCWNQTPQGYAAVLRGKPVLLHQDANGLHAFGSFSREELRHYLDLDRDYAAVAAQYSHIAPAKHAIQLYPGLRVLNQDPWETVISFILSANNNVSRIRNLTLALSRALGPAFEIAGETIYGLPDAQTLADCPEEKLRALGVGYRAPYLKETARMVLEGFPLWELKNMPYAQAHAMLTKLSGVGDKVADCVLLFGCEHTSAFPVDVWVERLLKSWFRVECKSRRSMMCCAREMLGENAGLLQQFLFHAARMGDIEL